MSPSMSPTTFVGIGILLFIAAVFRPLKRAILNGLDSRADKIQNDLEEAQRLKEEAQAVLASIERKQLKANEEAEEIIEHAKAEAKHIRNEAKAKLEKELNKRTELAMQRISQAETAVIDEIKANAVDITVNAAKTIIADNLGKEAANDLMDQAIEDIERKIH